MEEHKKAIQEQIELKKRHAIENIENEHMVPAMWDVAELIDLKAQLNLFKDMEDENE